MLYGQSTLPLSFGMGSCALCLVFDSIEHFVSENFAATGSIMAVAFAAKEVLTESSASSFLPITANCIAWSGLGMVLGHALARRFVKLPLLEKSRHPDKNSTHAVCKSIIQARSTTLSLKNKLTARAARAEPNLRLQVAFDIDNCFITDDQDRCKVFRAQVEKIIHVDLRRWEEFAITARAIAQKEFGTDATSINLFSLIQVVTMKMTRTVMWDIAPETDDNDEAIGRLAHKVNQQWLRSKGDFKLGDQPSWRYHKQYELQQALNDAFPGWKGNMENPLNLILPGYVTMWSVVLRCFVELTSRSHSKTPE